MRKVDGEYGKDWWFKVWGPEKLAARASAAAPTGCSRPNAKWHGFGNLADGFNMLDPIKCTHRSRRAWTCRASSRKTGIPAAIVTKYLAEHGVIVEKTGLYSFFIMFTIGITKGRWNTLLTALQQFKDDYDRNQPMWTRDARVHAPRIRGTSGSGCATCARASTSSTHATTSPASSPRCTCAT